MIYTYNLHERQSSKGNTLRAFGEIKLRILFLCDDISLRFSFQLLLIFHVSVTWFKCPVIVYVVYEDFQRYT